MFAWFKKWNDKRKLNNLRNAFIKDLETTKTTQGFVSLMPNVDTYCALGRAAVVANIPIQQGMNPGKYNEIRDAYRMCKGGIDRIYTWNDSDRLSFYMIASKIRENWNTIFCDGESNAA